MKENLYLISGIIETILNLVKFKLINTFLSFITQLKNFVVHI